MHILFPCSPINQKQVDEDYAAEQDAARAAGFETALYSHEALEADEKHAMFQGGAGGRDYLLRGWMVTGDQYAMLCASAEEQGSHLLTSAAAYAEAHYLPLAYRHLEGETPESRWIEGDDPEAAWQLYLPLQAGDAIVKDWVKSAKHRWREACFLPAGTTRERFGQIFANFRQARGHLFNRGVVIKRFVPLSRAVKICAASRVWRNIGSFISVAGCWPGLRWKVPPRRLPKSSVGMPSPRAFPRPS